MHGVRRNKIAITEMQLRALLQSMRIQDGDPQNARRSQPHIHRTFILSQKLKTPKQNNHSLRKKNASAPSDRKVSIVYYASDGTEGPIIGVNSRYETNGEYLTLTMRTDY